MQSGTLSVFVMHVTGHRRDKLVVTRTSTKYAEARSRPAPSFRSPGSIASLAVDTATPKSILQITDHGPAWALALMACRVQFGTRGKDPIKQKEQRRKTMRDIWGKPRIDQREEWLLEAQKVVQNKNAQKNEQLALGIMVLGVQPL